MRLTSKSEYSLLALIHIARHQDNGYIKVQDICENYDISKKYLEQLLTIMKQSMILKTRRGSEGGYKLARPAAEISIAQVIRLMDGALAPTESVSQYFFSHTPLEKEVKILAVFKEIRDFISNRLENLKLSDLV
jgi:Rrf2 family transcriptional regulator, cysteine metabolism repressor